MAAQVSAYLALGAHRFAHRFPLGGGRQPSGDIALLGCHALPNNPALLQPWGHRFPCNSPQATGKIQSPDGMARQFVHLFITRLFQKEPASSRYRSDLSLGKANNI